VQRGWRWEKGKLTSGIGVVAAAVRKARGRAARAGDGAASGLGRDTGRGGQHGPECPCPCRLCFAGKKEKRCWAGLCSCGPVSSYGPK
jgi:hypothetical protein